MNLTAFRCSPFWLPLPDLWPAAVPDWRVMPSGGGPAGQERHQRLDLLLPPLLLCDEAIEAKQLTVLEGPEEGRRAYWLVAPRPQWRQKKVKALVAFLTGGAAA